MSIEERFEKWINKRENIEGVVLKALPIISGSFLVAGLNINNKIWKYTFLIYSGVFAGTFLYCKYVKFKERTKKYNFGKFIQYVARLYGTREET